MAERNETSKMEDKPYTKHKFCANPECQEYLDPEWTEAGRRYCSRSCRNAVYYASHKTYHQKLYLKHKGEWKKSWTGRLGGVSIYAWLKLPREFK